MYSKWVRFDPYPPFQLLLRFGSGGLARLKDWRVVPHWSLNSQVLRSTQESFFFFFFSLSVQTILWDLLDLWIKVSHSFFFLFSLFISIFNIILRISQAWYFLFGCPENKILRNHEAFQISIPNPVLICYNIMWVTSVFGLAS